MFLIDGPDFDCVSVTVWPTGYYWKAARVAACYSLSEDCSLGSVEAEFQQLPMDSQHNPFLIFHNPGRA